MLKQTIRDILIHRQQRLYRERIRKRHIYYHDWEKDWEKGCEKDSEEAGEKSGKKSGGLRLAAGEEQRG